MIFSKFNELIVVCHCDIIVFVCSVCVDGVEFVVEFVTVFISSLSPSFPLSFALTLPPHSLPSSLSYIPPSLSPSLPPSLSPSLSLPLLHRFRMRYSVIDDCYYLHWDDAACAPLAKIEGLNNGTNSLNGVSRFCDESSDQVNHTTYIHIPHTMDLLYSLVSHT